MYSDFIKEDDLVRTDTKQYVYDNYGNILSKKIYEYNTTDLIHEDKYEYTNSNWQDLLTKFNNESITYDEIGNPTSIGNKTLTWMNGRELSTYSDGTNNISYKYNLDGIRTSKVVNGIKTNCILEGSSIIFEDRNGDVIYYIYNGSELLGFVYKDKTYYYHKNMFGDIIGILDSNYNEIVTYEYDSWGALVNITDNSNINLGTINPFRYRSYYYDEETKLYYLNARYYNPEVGRFINADVYVSTGQGIIGNNMFVYCGNNFLNMKDSEGNFGWLAALAVVATVLLISGCEGKNNKNQKQYGAAREYEQINGYKNGINCYAYAIGDNENRQPGDKSNFRPKINDVRSVGKAVEAEFKLDNRSIREIEGPYAEINSNEYIIALRVGTKPYSYSYGVPQYDYHFMVQTNTGQWAEKHGPGGSTVLWDYGRTPDDIPWTLDGVPYYDSEIIYYAITD